MSDTMGLDPGGGAFPPPPQIAPAPQQQAALAPQPPPAPKPQAVPQPLAVTPAPDRTKWSSPPGDYGSDEANAAIKGDGASGGGVQAVQAHIKNAVKAAVQDEWTKAGYPSAAVAGIVRNVDQESGFDPYILGDYKDGKPTSIGLNQHHKDRAERLVQHLEQERARGADLKNPVEMARAQTRFSIKEMNGADPIAAKGREALMKEIDPNSAYGIFRAAFERPKTGPVPMSLVAHDLPLDARAALEEFHAAGARERDTITQDKLDLQRMAMAEPPGSAKRQKLEDEMHVKIAEREKQWEEKWQHPPIMKPVDALENFGSVATIVSLIGGLFARKHLTAALAASGAAMQAINQNKYDEYERSMKTWDLQTRSAMEIIKMQREDLASLLKDDDRAWDHKMAMLGIKLKEYGMDREVAASERGDAQTTLNTMLTWDRSQNQMKNIVGSMQLNNHTMFVNNERQKYYSDHPDQVGQPIPNDVELKIQGEANEKFPIQGMPKAVAETPAKRMDAEVKGNTQRLDDAFIKEHPDATPEEKAEAHHKNDLAARSEMAMATARSGTGSVSDEQASLLADQYIQGNYAVITALPRSGPSRIKVENMVAEKMRGMPDAARTITMNRLRMVEAESAARTAGRVTMQTEMYATEAEGAGREVVRTSSLFPRTEFPKVNVAIRAFEQNTGDPRVIQFGAALNSLMNAYGKMSNPTGTGIHDADKERLANILDTSLSQWQIEGGVEQIIKEGHIMSNAAEEAQRRVLGRIAPRAPGQPDEPPRGAATPATPIPTSAGGPPVGTVDQGLRFKGGDFRDPANWVPQ